MNRVSIFFIAAVWMLFCPLVGSEEFKEIVLGEQVFILERGPWLDNLTVIDAGPSLIVVDTWSSPPAAEKARALIDQRFHKPISHVFNTHHHWDHTFGNQVFAGATIVGHEYCLEDMVNEYSTPASRFQALEHARSRSKYNSVKDYIGAVEKDIEKDFRLAPPTQRIGDRGTFKIGNLTCRLYHVPGLHTRSNLTVFIPELGLLFTRREFDGQALPVLEAEVDLDKLIFSLEDIIASGRPVKFILTSHGQPVADPDLLPALDYLRILKATVREFRLAGRTMEELKAAVAFASFPAVKKNLASHQANLGIVWKENPQTVQPFSAISPDRAAIEKLHQTDMAAAKIRDINTLITLWTDDGILLLPGLEPIRGKAAIWKYLQEQLPEAQKYEITEYRHQFEELQILGDWAYEWATFTGTCHLKSGGPDLQERARLFRILHRQDDGSWKCHRAMAQNLPEKK